MKPFHEWVSDMANSIEDASEIIKDEKGNIVNVVNNSYIRCKNCGQNALEEVYLYFD